MECSLGFEYGFEGLAHLFAQPLGLAGHDGQTLVEESGFQRRISASLDIVLRREIAQQLLRAAQRQRVLAPDDLADFLSDAGKALEGDGDNGHAAENQILSADRLGIGQAVQLFKHFVLPDERDPGRAFVRAARFFHGCLGGGEDILAGDGRQAQGEGDIARFKRQGQELMAFYENRGDELCEFIETLGLGIPRVDIAAQAVEIERKRVLLLDEAVDSAGKVRRNVRNALTKYAVAGRADQRDGLCKESLQLPYRLPSM